MDVLHHVVDIHWVNVGCYMQLRPYQQQAKNDVYSQWQQGDKNVLYVLATGGGKCLGKNTLVLMYDGTIRNVQDVKSGELLMGPDSEPRTVLSTCAGSEMLYRVTPVKGDPYIVNESHILSLKKTGLSSKPIYPCQRRKGEIVNITVKDYLSKSKHFKHTHKGWRTGVDFDPSELNELLPPYLLGVWLGDGTSRTSSITTADPEIVDYIYQYAEHNDFPVRVECQKNNKSKVYHINGNFKHTNTMRSLLRQYGLLKNKHIPHDYKTGSHDQRIQLLAGMMDSDGYYDGKGCYDIVLKSEKLINDLAFVARSLGFAAYIKPCRKKCTNTGATGDYFRMNISGDVSKIPTILQRHQPEPRRQKKSVLVTGVKVEPIGVGNYYGFEITGDRLFMLGDFTVTHNTVTLSSIVHDHQGATCVIAHRQELVSQISIALAREGVKHKIIGPSKIIKFIIKEQLAELGVSMYDPNAQVAVAGVDTLVRRQDQLAHWTRQVTLWVIDEAHHIVTGNKWGKACEMFPNAKGLGVTATPIRADGHGLGRDASGVFDSMIEGPDMRWLIAQGNLTDYRIFAPPSDLDVEHVDVSQRTGDYNPQQLKKAVQKSHLVGDVVLHYKRIAMGKLGVTFATDVETATEIANQFNAEGVPAEVVSAKTPDHVRSLIIKRFRKRELMQLVNVDLFGEGFDLPAIEVVSMARPTQSYSLFAQQFGRALRPLEGKTVAIIIDHAGNVVRHGLPDKQRKWSLDSRDKRPPAAKPDDDIPLRYCVQCTQPYERINKCCPWCGHYPEPDARSGPEYVDGDLLELSPDVLESMRQAVIEADESPESVANRMRFAGAPEPAWRSAMKKIRTKQEVQNALRASMTHWAEYQAFQGKSDSESYRLFYHLFGTDVMSAQTLGKNEALLLAERINEYIGNT